MADLTRCEAPAPSRRQEHANVVSGHTIMEGSPYSLASRSKSQTSINRVYDHSVASVETTSPAPAFSDWRWVRELKKKRLLGLLGALACLLVSTPPAMADSALGDATQLPDHIVNGSFEYHRDMTTEWGWNAVIPATGKLYSRGWSSGPSDWSESKFGWHSTQTDGDAAETKAGAVEIQSFGRDNTWGEISAAQAGAAIYQDIRVVPGITYHWSLKHQSLVNANTMQVLIGEPGKETPQPATRTKTNGGNDQLGPVGLNITTANKLPYTNENRGAPENWETYEGNWTCPEGMTVARFSFSSIAAPAPNMGNEVDDIGFSQSTTLRYDPNGGAGTIADQTVGVGTSAYTATAGYTFAGHGLSAWNTKPDGSGDSYKTGATITIGKPTTLYAQWVDITQPALPETGGTVDDHYLLKTIGGGCCLFGLMLLALRRRRRSR